MAKLNLLALDYGASNGRGIIGQFDGKRIALHEVHRFENAAEKRGALLYWDIMRLYGEAKHALSSAHAKGLAPDAFGIDTWGVDYGLLDKNGQLLDGVRSYRNAVDADMEPLWSSMGRRALFDKTGVAHLCFNTVYQLFRRAREEGSALMRAETLLFLPDLLAYFFTGAKAAEYTFATTSMLYDPRARGWCGNILSALGLDAGLFPTVEYPGRVRARLKADVAAELGLPQIPFAVVGEHDTASAVAAIPGSGSFAFCSSGTWSLFGVETDTPVLTDAVYEANFSNEGTVQGGFRPLKNIMGLWIMQECRRDWQRQGESIGWDDIVRAAERAAPLRSIVDPDYAAFFTAGGMVEKLQKYCIRSGQPVPESIGEIARCVYESLALKYRWALTRLEEIKGEPIMALNIVGGGIQNRLLNQMAADATGRPVVTGPAEGAAMGNILMQAVALGELTGIEDARAVVRNSVETKEYLPRQTQAWQDAYGKLLQLMEANI